ncbi:MAG: medium chain dehydrogenase/reductase family protein [Deltaproteobacteria bacterium]|nr:medium chain dehydrogenase/reductase family protein [Deltaproteobacteria bacterium]
MRKVVVHAAGGHDRLKLEEAPALTPGPGEVLVEVRAAGINYADVMVRMGLYASAKELVGWPITPGFEVAGTVGAVGEGVKAFAVGDRVLAVTLFDGYASQVVVREVFARPIPGDLSFAQAAGFPSVYVTAWFALHELAHPRPGARLLVHSAAGGVGGCLVQLGKRAGCEVTGVVGRPEKLAALREHGADHCIDKSSQDLWAEARKIAPEGFDVICDANGIETLGASYAHLRPTGRLVVYGFHTMLPKGKAKPSWPKLAADWLRTPRFNPLDLTTENKSVLAFNLSFLFDRLDLAELALGDLIGWLEAGEIRPPPVTTYPFEEVARAHADLESGRTTGKLVLEL